MPRRRPSPVLSERGSAAIEFAISAIVVFVLIFGVVAVAMAFYTYEVVNEYARDATRFAIVHGAGCNSPINGSCNIGAGGDRNAPASIHLMTYLNHQIFPGIDGTKLQITTRYAAAPGGTCSLPCNAAGDQVTVTISYPFLYSVPFIPQQPFTMHASSTMVISQ